MSEPLDDYNRRMTAGGGSWTMGPATNAAESAAQSAIDARQPGAMPVGGGSIDFGVRVSAIVVLAGIALFVLGSHLGERSSGATAMTGLLLAIVSGFLLLVGVGGLVVGCIKGLGSRGGWVSLLLAVLASGIAWWLSPWLWMAARALLPKGLIPLAAVALVFAFRGRR